MIFLLSPEVLNALVFHVVDCRAGWLVLQARCGSSGMGATGVEDGNPGLSVAELLNYSCLPHPASVPLCSASAETSTAV